MVSEPDEEQGFDLLTSPLRNVGVARMLVYGGPLGLAVAIMLSLWASWMHVRHTVVVQSEVQWVANERLAVRAQLVPEGAAKIENLRGDLWIEQGERTHTLTDATVVEGGLIQAGFDVPDLALGPAELHVTLQADGTDEHHETIAVEVVTERTPREATPMVSASVLQHGDDSDRQLEPIRIDIRPEGRVVSEFDNMFWVRVLHPDGRPYATEVEVLLVDGELDGKKGEPEAPVQLARRPTDALGLVSVEGRLTSEVIRIEARVLSGETVRFKRRMRFVSYAGAVTVVPSVRHVGTAAELEVLAHGISAKRPVFVDVHAADGAWIDTFNPPVLGREEPRPWMHPGLPPGLLQFEAYNFTNNPGESAAIGRVHVVESDADAAESIRPLIEFQHQQLHVPRVELDWDRALERAYLEWVANASLPAPDVRKARAWLLGTLPVSVYGPPIAIDTRTRDLEAMAAKKAWWMMAMRILLLGGGGLFLAVMTLLMLRSHARAAASTMAELERLTEGRARVDIRQAVDRAKREALLRGMGVILVMAVSLVIATILLERLVWVY